MIAWASVIWIFSTDDFSGTGTGRFLTPVLQFLMPWADESQIRLAHAFVRKLGHVVEYALLALLVFRALDDRGRAVGRRALGTLGLCALYAATDEFHQAFVASRTSAASDVLLDTLGAGVGVAIAVWLGVPFSSGRRSPA